MTARRLTLRGLILAIAVSGLVGRSLSAADPRNYIEAVRRKATVVYVGEVVKVDLRGRGRLDINARATLRVMAKVRGPAERTPVQAVVRYSSYDETTPPLDGGPQYRLQPRQLVVVFTSAFDAADQPYLIPGNQMEVVRQVAELRRQLETMSPEQLARNEITEADRPPQIETYDRLLAFLTPR